jgi:hypothetical protein
MSETTGFVQIMRSCDYSNFTICLPLPEAHTLPDGKLTLEIVDATRKQAAQLVDKAVEQFKRMKQIQEMRAKSEFERKRMREEVMEIEAMPEQERDIHQKAVLKAYRDFCYWEKRGWDYDYPDEDED